MGIPSCKHVDASNYATKATEQNIWKAMEMLPLYVNSSSQINNEYGSVGDGLGIWDR